MSPFTAPNPGVYKAQAFVPPDPGPEVEPRVAGLHWSTRMACAALTGLMGAVALTAAPPAMAQTSNVRESSQVMDRSASQAIKTYVFPGGSGKAPFHPDSTRDTVFSYSMMQSEDEVQSLTRQFSDQIYSEMRGTSGSVNFYGRSQGGVLQLLVFNDLVERHGMDPGRFNIYSMGAPFGQFARKGFIRPNSQKASPNKFVLFYASAGEYTHGGMPQHSRQRYMGGLMPGMNDPDAIRPYLPAQNTRVVDISAQNGGQDIDHASYWNNFDPLRN